MTLDPRVDDYLERLPDWQRETLQRVRDLLHEADPEMVETIKRRVQPYFVLDGNATARTIGFREGDEVPVEPLLEFFRRLVADNRAGGWRRLKGRPRDA
jgi:hypothetical protein